MSGGYPNAINIAIIMHINTMLTNRFDKLTKVGIVDTGYFILVTRNLYFLIDPAPAVNIFRM